jgi:hypothetical protein
MKATLLTFFRLRSGLLLLLVIAGYGGKLKAAGQEGSGHKPGALPLDSVLAEVTDPNLRALLVYEDSLVILGDSLVRGSSYEVREAACVAFIPMLVKALRTPDAFEFPFERVKTLSVVKAPDESFRLFSFQMMLWDYTYRYFGAIQYRDDELRLTPLIDASLFMPDSVLPTAVLGPEEWYGAIYYGITSRKHKGKTYYFLFGFDGLDLFSSRKLVEVLQFQDERPVFGAPLFPDQNDPPAYSHRFILEYKKEASASLNYDTELEQIVFDHLVPENPLSEGIRSTYIPDGTYQGFQWDTKKGHWDYVDKVFTQMQLFAPDYSPEVDPSQDPFNYENRSKKREE